MTPRESVHLKAIPEAMAVAASPRERLFLTIVLFAHAAGSAGLTLTHPAAGRGFRALLSDLKLRDIRRSIVEYGHVDFKLANDRRHQLFEVSRTAILFVRDVAAYSPRSLDQEDEMGALLDGLLAMNDASHSRSDLEPGPAPPWHTDVPPEHWEPAGALEGKAKLASQVITGADLQRCISQLEAELEQLPDQVQKAIVLGHLGKFFSDVSDLAAPGPTRDYKAVFKEIKHIVERSPDHYAGLLDIVSPGQDDDDESEAS